MIVFYDINNSDDRLFCDVPFDCDDDHDDDHDDSDNTYYGKYGRLRDDDAYPEYLR